MLTKYDILQMITNCIIFYRKELGKAKKMKENVPSYKDESTKITDNQSTVVNILFLFSAVSRRRNSVNLRE